jgi:hypothetical protein
MIFTMRVVETESGREHVLPGDVVTCETRSGRYPLLPLGYRARGQVFYVSSERWPELEGKALRTRPE